VPTAKPVRAKRQPSSRDKVIAAHRRTPDASDAALAARLKVSEVTVKRHRPAKAVDSVSTDRQVNGRVPELEEVAG
jgi:putative heme iron utilization protein